MKHDAHTTSYRVHLAKLTLGKRHILHSDHSGDVSHNPSEVDVAKTIRRAQRNYARDWDAAHVENETRNSQERQSKVRQLIKGR